MRTEFIYIKKLVALPIFLLSKVFFCFMILKIEVKPKPEETRDAFPAAKIRKEGYRKVFNVWTESYFSNFEVGLRTFPW